MPPMVRRTRGIRILTGMLAVALLASCTSYKRQVMGVPEASPTTLEKEAGGPDPSLLGVMPPPEEPLTPHVQRSIGPILGPIGGLLNAGDPESQGGPDVHP